MSRRMECTIDANGQVRSGPPGAWWSHLQPRPGAGGVSPELPHHRSVLWNAWLLGTVALALVLIEFAFHGPWLETAAFFFGPIVAAVPLALVVGRISRRRFERLGVPLTPMGQAEYPAAAAVEPIQLAGRGVEGLPTCHCQGHGTGPAQPRGSRPQPSPDVDDLLLVGQAVAADLEHRGERLTRDALLTGLRARDRGVSATRASELLRQLRGAA